MMRPVRVVLHPKRVCLHIQRKDLNQDVRRPLQDQANVVFCDILIFFNLWSQACPSSTLNASDRWKSLQSEAAWGLLHLQDDLPQCPSLPLHVTGLGSDFHSNRKRLKLHITLGTRITKVSSSFLLPLPLLLKVQLWLSEHQGGSQVSKSHRYRVKKMQPSRKHRCGRVSCKSKEEEKYPEE